jgi:hypothetical protein
VSNRKKKNFFKFRFAEESTFWYTAQKDYLTAVLSLTKIAEFNGIVFGNVFREAQDFIHGKRSKGIQCDFQPLLRLGLLFLNQNSFLLKKKYFTFRGS